MRNANGLSVIVLVIVSRNHGESLWAEWTMPHFAARAGAVPDRGNNAKKKKIQTRING